MSAANPGDINIFQILHQERTTYGLRSGDYARYHKHLSSRLAKLRAALNIQHTTAKSAKFKKHAALDGNDVKDARTLEMVLLEAERAHTTSLALHQTYLSAPAATRQTSMLHNSHTRSSKSLVHANNLLTLLTSLPSTASPRSLGQAKIYHLILQAALAFKKEDYESALPAYIVARSLLGELAQGEDTPRGEALALGWMDDEVDPRIRFCAYKLGRKDSHDVQGIVAEFDGDDLTELLTEYEATEISQALTAWAGQEGRERKKMGKVVWLEKEIEFRNADVVVVMEKVEKALARLDGTAGAGSKKMRAYDRVLGELGEAYEKVKRIRSDGQASSSSSSSAPGGQTDLLLLLQDYLLHSLLSNRIARDSVLIKTLLRPATKATGPSTSKAASDPADLLKVLPSVIKLYDGIIKGWEAIRELGAVEADGDVSEAVEGKIGFFRAKRIYYLSKLHLLLPATDAPSDSTSPSTKALLLLSRSSLLLRQLLHTPKTYPSDLNALTESDIESLERDIADLEGEAKRQLYRETVGGGADESKLVDLARDFIQLKRRDDGAVPSKKAAGKKPASVASTAPAPAAGGILAPAVAVVEQVKKAVVGGGGESSEDEDEDHFEEAAEGEEDVEDESSEEEEEEAQAKKGWLGGWFGRK